MSGLPDVLASIFNPRLAVELSGAAVITLIVWILARRSGGRLWMQAADLRIPTAALVLCAALLPIAIRLALLPWVPQASIVTHDEFGHLLVADTLLHGRLANPPHAMWRHFETIFVLHQPSYASVYPLGQGIVLAAGRLLTGQVYGGPLLAVALMCGGIAWMLAGILPRVWAAIGTVLAVFLYGLAPHWINSYWGGAFGAFGGALYFGALARLYVGRVREDDGRTDPPGTTPIPARVIDAGPSVLRLALVAAVGWCILWLTRPFESVLLFAVLWTALAWFAWRDRARWTRWVAPALAVILIQAAAGAVTLLHNRAVTGSPWLLPYHHSRVMYGVPQTFLWQAPVPKPEIRVPEIEAMYDWSLEEKLRADADPLGRFRTLLFDAWAFFVTPWFTLPLLLLLPLVRTVREVRIAVVLVGTALVLALAYSYFFPHYFAAYTAVFAFLIVRGLVALDRVTFRGAALGRWVVIFLVAGGVMRGERLVPFRELVGLDTTRPVHRGQLERALAEKGGDHLVFVRYGPKSTFHYEWVYNAAAIDRAPIVWARAIDSAADAELVRYYGDRQVWLAYVNEDEGDVRVTPYAPEHAYHADADGAAWVLTRQPVR